MSAVVDRAGWRRALALVALAVLLTVWATPAHAHTALLGSSPTSGERLAYSPDEVVLSFAAPVDLATVAAELRAADGAIIDLQLASAESPTDVVVFEVPRLSRDVYGLSWQSVGDDGHRVRGEVVFGVGIAPGEGAVTGSAPDPVALGLDAAAGVARAAWYLALALLAALAVLGRRVGSVAAGRATAWVPAVLLLVAGAAAARAAIGAATVLQAGGDVGQALLSRPTGLWTALAATSLLGALLTRRGRQLVTPAWWLLAAVLGGTLAGHAPARPDPVAAVAFGAVHLGAAAVWTGPVLGLALLAVTSGWRALPAEDRRRELQQALVGVARSAGWALVAVAGSGLLLALRAADGSSLGGVVRSGAFGMALVLKTVVVLAIAIPLGVAHHRRRERWTGLPRTVRVEAAALLTAMLLGSVLVGTDPGWGTGEAGGTDVALAALLEGTDDPADCAALDVGRAACYRTSLAALLIEQGPEPAIDALESLSTSDDYVTANCHQVAHDLGNDAAEQIEDMGTALAVEASICWSGYYHGFVEARLAEIDDADLIAALPSFCDDAAEVRYSFTHYNCLHGLGHGLMLRGDADLFVALPLCDEAGEPWAVRSCASGVFMENVMAAQQGLPAAFDDADPLYPCTAIEGDIVEDCYLMQTSHILWDAGGDIAAGFAACDTAPQQYRPTCYRSMGRDISSRAALQADEVVRLCELGDAELARWCYDGAAANAVYETAQADAADPLCALLDGDELAACTAASEQAASTIARG